MSKCAALKCSLVQVLATSAVWEVFSNAEAVAFVAVYGAAAFSKMSAADALSWETQQRLKARNPQVFCLPFPDATPLPVLLPRV